MPPAAARSRMATDVGSSHCRPKVMVPRQSRETRSPVRPRRTCRMAHLLTRWTSAVRARSSWPSQSRRTMSIPRRRPGMRSYSTTAPDGRGAVACESPILSSQERALNATAEPNRAAAEPNQSLITVTHAIYGLHAVSLITGIVTAASIVFAFLTGWPSIIAVILNYVKRGEARGTWLESHFRWQIRTFWWGLLWVALCLAFVVATLGIGLLIAWLPLMVVGFWFIYRIAKRMAPAGRSPSDGRLMRPVSTRTPSIGCARSACGYPKPRKDRVGRAHVASERQALRSARRSPPRRRPSRGVAARAARRAGSDDLHGPGAIFPPALRGAAGLGRRPDRSPAQLGAGWRRLVEQAYRLVAPPRLLSSLGTATPSPVPVRKKNRRTRSC